ncbi:M20/M25/M40 family metallo-hydrolase [Telluribacter humicola]
MAFSSFAQQKKDLPVFNLTKEVAEAHLRFLASDELMGRRTGEMGNRVAARYLAEQFRKYGATPVPGQSTFYQTVPLERIGASGKGELVVNNEPLRNNEDWMLIAGDAASLSAPVVYAGYGLEDTAKGWEDYKGVDVKGKIVLVQSGSPDNQTPAEIIASSNRKRQIAGEKGAVALIELFTVPIPWNIVTRNFTRDQISLAQGNEGATRTSLPHVWVNGKEARLTRLLRAANTTAQLSTEGRKSERIVSHNVAAYIQGSDPKLRDEYIILSAHYDHVGVGKQGGQPYTAEDSIFNGARDNAFGCVALLSSAEALAKNPPKRSVLILAVTGEELGLLGSRYYASNSLLALNKCIFNLNSDGAGYNDTSIVSVIGLDRTGAKAEIEAAAKVFGLDVVADPSPEQGLFDRSDNVNFAIKGIPSPTFTPGFRKFDQDIMKNYHQVSDNPETVDFGYLLKFSQAYTYAARLIADRTTAPQWTAGDKYEEAAKKLYVK